MARQARAGTCEAGAVYAGVVYYKLLVKIDPPEQVVQASPTGDGDTGDWIAINGGNFFAEVDDPPNNPDDDATYIFLDVGVGIADRTARFTFSAPSIPTDLEIRSVRVYLRTRKPLGPFGSLSIFGVLRIGGVNYEMAPFDQFPAEDYATNFAQWQVSPVTGLPWTVADIADIQQFGITGINKTIDELRCTQLYLEVRLGQAVTRGVQLDSLSIGHIVSQPSTCMFQVEGYDVAGGQRVLISDDGAQNYIFGGQIDTVGRILQRGEPTKYDVSCTDWMWLANSVPIRRIFTDLSVNTIVSALIEDGRVIGIDLRPGSVPDDLGTVSVVLSGVTFFEAMTQVCAAANTLFSVRPNLHVDVYRDEPPHGNVIELNDDVEAQSISVQTFQTNVRTEVSYECKGSQTSAAVAPGSLTIPVQDISPFVFTVGGNDLFIALPGVQPILIVGVNPFSGPGTLNLSTPCPISLAEGDQVSTLVVEVDSNARNRLSDALGNGLSGVRRLHFINTEILPSEGRGRCLQHLAFYGRGIEQVGGELNNVNVPSAVFRHWNVAGRFVQVDLIPTVGAPVQGEMRLSTVTLEALPDIVYSDGDGGSSQRLRQRFELRPGKRQDIVDILVQQVI